MPRHLAGRLVTVHRWQRVALGLLRCAACGVERVAVQLPLATAIEYRRAGVSIGTAYPRCE